MNIRNLSMKNYRGALVELMKTRLAAVENNEYDVNLPLFVWGSIGVGK